MHLEFHPCLHNKPQSATTTHAVNAIPYVRAADQGAQTFLDLPWIMGADQRNSARKHIDKQLQSH